MTVQVAVAEPHHQILLVAAARAAVAEVVVEINLKFKYRIEDFEEHDYGDFEG